MVAFRYWWLQKRKNAPQAKWDRAHRKTGEAIYRLATRMGGAFVKVGQVLGARADVLPPALVSPLRGLHDKMPPRPYTKLAKHVDRELGAKREMIASVEPTAIAAASLAQVHRGKLVTGEDVVLKIQYPEARRLFPIDLKSLRRAVRVARWLGGLDLRALADELAEFVALELDFEREAASTERIRKNLANTPPPGRQAMAVVPTVYVSTGKLLVLGFLKGVPLSAPDRLRERGVDLRDVAQRVATLFATMIFSHGYFHGDPHPGNILVLDDGRIGLLDFGLAKELPAGFGASAAKMIAAGMGGNAARAVEAARAMGFVIADEVVPELLGLVRALMGDYQGAGNLLKLARKGKLEIPSHFTLIMRVLVILSGVSHSLVPGERVIPGALLGALAPHISKAS